jgi:hypothetical protein
MSSLRVTKSSDLNGGGDWDVVCGHGCDDNVLLSVGLKCHLNQGFHRDVSVHTVHEDVELIYALRSVPWLAKLFRDIPMQRIGQSRSFANARSKHNVAKDFSPPLKALGSVRLKVPALA